MKLERLSRVMNAPNLLTDARVLSQVSREVMPKLYVKTFAKYSFAVTIPRTTSSKRKDGTEKRTLHRFSNEKH